jgi:site-specific DNA recombinase
MRAAIYSRFSTDRQTESSISDQVRICTEYAARAGWEIAQHFEDQGVSGAALGNRPGALKLLEAALARRVDAVLVTDLTRLSRSNGDLSKTIDRLVSKGVRIVGVQDGYDSARRGHKLQAGLSGIIGEAFRDMIKDRTFAALESRAHARKPTGGRAFGYVENHVHEDQAKIVREIFNRFADGESCRSIAGNLNARGVPSPGSTWKRTERRTAGWMGSGVRAMLQNARYRGQVIWNSSEWRKDPDSGRRKRVERPKSEWIVHHDEALRVVDDCLWWRVQQRFRPDTEGRYSRSGGKAKYLLSGLLVCDKCESHYVMANAIEYGCAGARDGACANQIRVRRKHAEDILLSPARNGLLTPGRVEKMRTEMQLYYRTRMKKLRSKVAHQPRELAELDKWLERLRMRLRAGDPDLTAADLNSAIERLEAQRKEVLSLHAPEDAGSMIFTMLPKAAELYRAQVEAGLDGDPKAAAKARVFLRDFLGKIRLVPETAGGLVAHWNLAPAALLNAVGSSGSGGRI